MVVATNVLVMVAHVASKDEDLRAGILRNTSFVYRALPGDSLIFSCLALAKHARFKALLVKDYPKMRLWKKGGHG